MIIKNSFDPEQTFTAGDDTRLQELLHPKNDPIECSCSIAHATIHPGSASRPHHLERQTEIFYILKGEGIIYIDDESATVQAGDIVPVSPRAKQWIENTGHEELCFLCIVQPPWRSEDEVIHEE